MTTLKYDYCIIGGGIAGTSTAYYLSSLVKQGKKVLLIEQDEISSKRASSEGTSRMYREMYSSAFYSQLMTSSLALWKDIETHSGVSLLKKNGLLFFGSQDLGETVEGSILGSKRTMEQLGLSFDYYQSIKDIQKRWPSLNPEKDDVAIFSENDGQINATLSCNVLARLAVKSGVKLMQGNKVVSVKSSKSHQRTLFLSNGDTVISKNLIITTGCWTKENLEKWFHLSLKLEIHSVIWGYYKVLTQHKNIPQWFCFRNKPHSGLFSDCDGLYYGFPVEPLSDTTETGFKAKVGIDFTPKASHYRPKSMSDFNYTPDKLLGDDLSAFLKVHWPCLGESLSLHASPYNMTADNDFVLGKLPNHENVVVFCGGNGRAFKFGPIIGKLLAELISNQAIEHNLSRFSPNRLL
jgi:glycine/D-amino acid oxidase-like deaminating enzyme